MSASSFSSCLRFSSSAACRRAASSRVGLRCGSGPRWGLLRACPPGTPVRSHRPMTAVR
ncbi:MAG: hypothetical protein LUG58_01005 [Clostridiales bacterium]|nr:hypothetical protein [Clostridiales bacterium]